MAGGIPVLKPLNDTNRLEPPDTPAQTSRTSSPSRRHFKTDALLQNLSPAAVLDALRTNNATLPSNGSKERILADSIEEASHHERALGIRAALAGKKLGEWIAELRQWHWPVEAFQPPGNGQDQHYFGSLPKTTVLDRQQRIDEIREELELLEIEELKHHVREIHFQPRSRAVSVTSQISTSSISYNHLADFHVLVTAMIVQALPDLLTLSRLLNDWSLRIDVLQQVPGFLQQLETTEMVLESAWSTIESAGQSGNGMQLMRNSYEQIKHILAGRVAELARRIDSILDMLEGHDYSIPDSWIDRVEEAESDYRDWVVEAESLVVMREWQATHQTTLGVSSAHDSEVYDSHDDRSQDGILFHDANEHMEDGRADNRDEDDVFSDAAEQQATTMSALNGPQPQDVEPPPTIQSANALTTRSLFFMRSTAPEPINLPQAATAQVQVDESSPLAPQSARQPPRRPAPLNLDTSTATIEDAPHSHVSALTAASSTGYTDMSSPQIFDASEIQYFKSPMDEHFPVIVTRDAEDIPSDRHNPASRYKHARSVSAIEPMTRSRASSVLSQVTINGKEDEDDQKQSIDQKLRSMNLAKQQIDEAQEELDPDPSSPDGSPTLAVRKVRLPVDETNRPQEIRISVANTNGHTTKSLEDKMTAKISRLLTRIPAPIKLSDHPLPASGLETDVSASRGNEYQLQQQRPVTPALTLSPVTSKAKTTSSNDSGVHVYHLHQPGKEVPIKLFIRLVGSEERVMVRVGGGWADLAEYLKEYAMHHGRRSVSSSNFELKGLPTAQNAASSLFDSTRSPTNSNNGTPASKHGTPILDRSSFVGAETPDFINKSGILQETSTSFPVTDDQPTFVGLAGPKTKKIELSPQKKAWVSGMLSQARHLSFEHKKPGSDLGDLGTVGNTKRVFMKGRPDGGE